MVAKLLSRLCLLIGCACAWDWLWSCTRSLKGHMFGVPQSYMSQGSGSGTVESRSLLSP